MLPITTDTDQEGNTILRVPPEEISDIRPNKIPRIPLESTDDLLDFDISFSKTNQYFSPGTIIGIQYEIQRILQFKSAYIIRDIHANHGDNWTFYLQPTYGGSELLTAKQTHLTNNHVTLERRYRKVRGGAPMTITPVDPEVIIESIGGTPNLISRTI